MSRLASHTVSRPVIVASALVGVVFVLLLAVLGWDSYRDLVQLRRSALAEEAGRVRSQATRVVGRLEAELEANEMHDFNEFSPEEDLVASHLEPSVQHDQGEYAALIDVDGRVLFHTRAERQGERLGHDWYDRVVFEVESDVFATHSPVLAQGNRAFDVRIPVEVHGRQVGEYHSGIDATLFEQSLAARERAWLVTRGALLAGGALMALLAGATLFYSMARANDAQNTVDSQSIAAASEMGKLAGGLAHEIRNPLHAIKLNLHALRRAQQRGDTLPADDVTAMLDQSTREVERIAGLMQQMVGFATPDEPRSEVLEVSKELSSVVDFIDEEMRRSNIEIETVLPQDAAPVAIDRGRFRQIMLNLLQNAQQAMVDGGRIVVSLATRGGRAEVRVADNGPGIPESERERIFEPFYSTKQHGTGLGLALVRRYVRDLRGEIRCERNDAGGATFRILFGEIRKPAT